MYGGVVPLSRVNPVAQLAAIGIVTATLLTSLDLVTPAVVLGAELALLPAARLTRPALVLRRTWPLLLGAATVGVVNAVVGDAGFVAALGLALRVVGLALPGVLLAVSTDPVRLADALTVHWRFPTRFAYGALAALRLVPLLVQERQTIRLARRARGVEAGRNPVAAVRLAASGLFVLLVGAVRRASRLATAMDSRGFDSGIPRSNARGSVLRRGDYLFVAVTLLICAAAVTLSIALGTWSPLFIGS